MISFTPDPNGRTPWLHRDTFNSPNGTPIQDHTPDVGNPWTAHSGTPIIQDGTLVRGGSGQCIATTDVSTTDVSLVATLECNGTSGMGLVFWFTDTDNFLFVYLDFGNQRITLLRYNGGALSELARKTATLVQGESYRAHLEVVGRRMYFCLEGVASFAFDNLPTAVATSVVGVRMPGNFGVSRFQVRAGHLPFPTVTASASNAVTPLTIPTYDGSGQATHPSVVRVPGGWGSDANGKAWVEWMAMTPYANSNRSLENPSIVVSDGDGTWIVPPGLTNPLVSPPAGGYYSDPDLLLVGGTMYLVYRETDFDVTFDRLWATTSTDGINWTEPVEVMTRGRNELLSPALTYLEASGRWVMYVVNRSPTPTLEPRVVAYSADSLTGPWVETPIGGLPNPPHATARPWHLSVLRDGDVYYMLLNDDQSNRALWLGASYDGLHWTFGATPLLSPGGEGAWDDGMLYRGCLVRTETGFDMWYAAMSAAGVWGIAEVPVTLA